MTEPTTTGTAWRRTIVPRIAVLAAGFAVWAVAIQVRLVDLQVFQRAALQARADDQSHRRVETPARRGNILDREGNLLAGSVDRPTITAVPVEIKDPVGTAEAICRALDCSPEEQENLARRFANRSGPGHGFAYVRRRVTQSEEVRVASLGLPGISSFMESTRFYPNRSLAAHLLGYVGTENQGLAGLEYAYDRQILGRKGVVLVQKDNKGRAISPIEQPPTEGPTLELTIDEFLQNIAEGELRAGVAENRAEAGCVVVLDPNTGEILAFANEPTFNLNMFKTASDEARRNRAVQDVYEPGSTFKIVTASAALEEGVIAPDDPVDVSAGMIRIGSRVVRDVHRYGVLSFADVLVKSSNVGAIKVGLRLGSERLSRYVHRFGFGARVSPDFPGENPGYVWDAAGLSDSAVASVSMGYQVAVTPLQMAAAVSAVANGGELIEPRVVRALIAADGRRTEVPRRVIRRAIEPATARTLTAIMEDVVQRGTATQAQIPGYTIAGKTGTSQQLIDHRYSDTEYNASFVGFLPSRKPALTILVLIKSPHAKGYYGGAVAAPIFRRIAEQMLRYLGIPPNVGAPPPILVVRPDRLLRAGMPAPNDPVTVIATAHAATPSGVVPDLAGLSARDAARALAKIGLTPRMAGDGVVVNQTPPPGTPIEPGAVCTVSLARLRPGAASGMHQ